MPAHYSFVEPHPTVKSYTHTGRGGAGNAVRAYNTSDGHNASGPASHFAAGIPSTATRFSSGRGGAGNIHSSAEKAVFSFDEELQRAQHRDQQLKDGAAFHTGRGGAGNWGSTTPASASNRKDSSSSHGSERTSGFFGRLSHSFDRH